MEEPIDDWLQKHVNDYCGQTGKGEVTLADLIEFLYEIDAEMTDRVIMKYGENVVLRPKPVRVK